MPREMPWSVDTPQIQGRKAEVRAARREGARLHPNSGAGHTKNDYSTDDTVFEHKTTTKTHTIKGEDLLKLFVNAARQGKSACYVIEFEGVGLTLRGEVTRG